MPLDCAAAGICPYIYLAGVNNTLCHFERINCYVVPNRSSSFILVVYGFTRHIRNCKIGSDLVIRPGLFNAPLSWCAFISLSFLRSKHWMIRWCRAERSVPSQSLDVHSRRRNVSSRRLLQCRPVFLKRRAATRYRALSSIIPGRERFSWNLSF